ncbi:MAG: N4-gp56 family major capsid protein, partial [Phenylobacterium sp.]|uniref:N4-gp56 family major capsid protein n=1 Tax=Phenylobacterium sp. TaxID=1871053 RepID=UPI001A41DAE0
MQTEYGVNDPSAQKLWSKKLEREALKATFIGGFMGEGTNALIQIKPELKKNAGDKITTTLRMQLSGAGVMGDGTLEGNEEPLTTYTDNLFIDQLRHAVRSKGKMSEQRVPWSVRAEAKDGLTDWWAERFDTWFFNQVCGYTVQTDLRYTGLNAVTAPSTVIRPTGSTDQGLGSGNVFTLDLIDRAVAAAKKASPVVRPIKIKGKDHWPVVLHTDQVTSLRTNTASGQWLDIQKAAMAGGNIDGNPIATGMLGVYNGAMLYESTRITNGVHSSTGAAVSTVRRAVLLGAQAAVLAFGQGYDSTTSADWNEELFDYGNQLGVEAGFIAGLKKTRYNGADLSTIV